MKICASAASHPGRCREKNEDNFCFNGEKLFGNATSKMLKLSAYADTPILMGVFDGMGGMAAGEVASGVAADVACSTLPSLAQRFDLDTALSDICKRANVIACNLMRGMIRQRIGTTAAMLCFLEDRYHLCNIGDSPIYLFRGGRLIPIFREHTEKENYLRIHGAEAVLPKKKFKLTQHIGIFPEEMEIEPFAFSGELKKKDRFLIASDGLTDMVDEGKIAEILWKQASPAKTTELLLRQALDNGGKDNITIICIDIK